MQRPTSGRYHPGLELDLAKTGGELVVVAQGAIDVYTGPLLRDRLIELLDSGVRRVGLDMRGVEAMDSRGLAALLSALRRFRLQGGEIAPCWPQAHVRPMLELARFDTVVAVESPTGAADDHFCLGRRQTRTRAVARGDEAGNQPAGGPPRPNVDGGLDRPTLVPGPPERLTWPCGEGCEVRSWWEAGATPRARALQISG